MDRKPLGPFKSFEEAVPALREEFLKLRVRRRRAIYAGSKPALLIGELFRLLEESISINRNEGIRLNHTDLQRIADRLGLDGKVLANTLKRVSGLFTAWPHRESVAKINGHEFTIVVSGEFTGGKDLFALLAVDFREATTTPDSCKSEPASEAKRHLDEYIRWLQLHLQTNRRLDDSFYLPVNAVTLPDTRRADRYRTEERSDRAAVTQRWRQVRIEHSAVAVVSRAGAGKTSLLRHETLNLCDAFLRTQPDAGQWPGTYVPIHLRLSTVSNFVASRSLADLRWLRDALLAEGAPSGAAETLLEYRDQLRLIFFLDGLDEVAWKRRDAAEAVLIDLSERRFPVVFSSRVESYSFSSRRLRELYREVTIPPFEPTETLRYIDSRFSRQKGKRDVATRLAKTSALSNPLLIALLCNVIDESTGSGPLPRHEIFDRVVRSLLAGEWRELDHVERRLRDHLVEGKLALLEHVAIAIARKPHGDLLIDRGALEREIAISDAKGDLARGVAFGSVVDALVEGDGILVQARQSPPCFEFLHPTIWSFFAARSLQNDDYSIALERSWFSEPWADVVTFVAGMLANRSELLTRLAEEPDIFHDRLFLSLRCLAETHPEEVGSAIADRIVHECLELFTSFPPRSHPADLPQWLSGAAPFVYPAVLKIFNADHTGPDKITELLAATTQDSRGPAVLQRAISDADEYVGFRYGLIPAAAEFLGPDVIRWVVGPGIERPMHVEAAEYLADRLKLAFGRVLPPTVLAAVLAQFDSEEPQSANRYVWAHLLAWFDNPEAEQRVWKLIADSRDRLDDRVELLAIQLLRKEGLASGIPASIFVQLTSQLLALTSSIVPETTGNALSTLASAPDYAVRLLAALVRSNGSLDEHTRQAARLVLADARSELQLVAATLLRETDFDLALGAVDFLSRAEHSSVRWNAISECRGFGPPAADIVMNRFSDKDFGVRRIAYAVAGELRLFQAVPFLMSVAESQNSDEADRAAAALEAIGCIDSVPLMIRRFGEGRSPARALARFHDDRVFDLLMDRWVRAVATPAKNVAEVILAEDLTEALGTFGDSAAVPILLGAVSSASPWIRGSIWSACDRLMRANNAIAISTAVLDSIDSLVFERGADTGAADTGSIHGPLDHIELDAVAMLLRRAAPSASRVLPKTQWRVWRQRCRKILAMSPYPRAHQPPGVS